MNIGTSSNTVFVVRFAHPNGFGTSQTPKTLYEMFDLEGDHGYKAH